MKRPGDAGWLDTPVPEPVAGHPRGGRPTTSPMTPGPSLAEINAKSTTPMSPPRPPIEKRRTMASDHLIIDKEQRDLVSAAIGFHLGGKFPGIEYSGLVNPLTDRFLELFGNDPQMLATLRSDVNTLYALTDEDIAGKIARGEPIVAQGDFFDAIGEIAWEVGATELGAQVNAEASDAVAGTFEALTSQEAATMTFPGAEEIEDTGPLTGYGVRPDMVKAQTFSTLFDVAGAWSFSASSRTLAVTVGDQTVGIRTRPGFNPESHLDVMAEVVVAQAEGRVIAGEITGGQGESNIAKIIDTAHRIGQYVEKHPAVHATLDQMWNNLSLAIDPVHAVQSTLEASGPLDRASDRIRDEKGQITAESVKLASVVPLPEDAMMASLARVFMSENELLTSQDALQLASEAVVENRPELKDEFSALTQEEFLKELEEDIEGRSALGGAIESGLGGVLDVMETYDKFTQWIGVNVIDLLKDQGLAIADFATGDPAAGFTHLKAVFEAQEFGTTAGDYFNLTGAAYDGANLAVGIGFDPLNVLMLGPKGFRMLAERALTNPEYAGIYLRMGSFPHVAKQIAEQVGPKATRNVAAMSGLSDARYLELMEIARDPAGTIGQVNAVWTRALYEDWLGEGPGRALRHSTVEGIGRALESIAAGKLDDATVNEWMKYMLKLSVGRTFKLGESQSIDNFIELLIMRFPHDADRFAGWFDDVINARMAAGDEVALMGTTAAMKEQARRAMWTAGGPTKRILETADPRAVNQNLRAVDDALTTLHEQGLDTATEATVRAELERMAGIMTRQVATVLPRLTEQQQARRLAHRQILKLAALEGDQAANAARNVMGGMTYRFFDDWARDLNKLHGAVYDEATGKLIRGVEVIPEVPGKINPLAPGTPVRDWEAVTGVKKLIAGDDPDLSLMMGLGVDDLDMARQADVVGMFSRSQKILLPASPHEIMLFEKLGETNKIAVVSQALRNQLLHKISSGMRLAFGVNLLLNPLTAGKVTLDETLRFFASTGEVGKFLHATAAGLPGVGGALDDLIRRVPKFSSKYGDRMINPYALQYKRNVGGWSADDYADFGWVMRPARRVGPGQMNMASYREQVERWVNGSLLNDRRFREYARWVDQATVRTEVVNGVEVTSKVPPPGWHEWWERGGDSPRPGKSDARTNMITIRNEQVSGVNLTSHDAFNILDRVFSHWLDNVVDNGTRADLRRRLLKAAVTPGDVLDVKRDRRLLEAVSQVPGLSGKTGVGSQIFNIFFGSPAGRRAGVFYEHLFDEAMGILLKRHGEKVITLEQVMKIGNVDKKTAQFYLKQGSDNALVGRLIRDTGARTEAQLASRAAVYAERRADDLMYRFTASSLAGRGVEAGLLMPFARAQTDFLSWWTDYMFQPMTARLTLEQRSSSNPAWQALTKMAEGVEKVPINLRAWAKYAHLVSAVNNDEPSIIDQTIDNLTFFPMHFDSEFLLDVSPQLGPLPSWLFDLMVDKGVIGEDLEKEIMAIFPALQFTELQDNMAEDWVDRVLPTSRRSLRDATTGTIRTGYAFAGTDIHTDSSLMGQLTNIIADGKVPASTGDFQTALAADFIADNVWDIVPGSDEWKERMNELAVQGAVQANRDEGWQDMKDRITPLTGYDAEYRALGAFESMFEDQRFNTLTAAGIFTASDLLEEDGVPRLKARWDRYKAGTATQDELEWLDDRLTTAYFEAGRLEVIPGFSYMDLMHLTNPELSVNLIAKNQGSGAPPRGGDRPVGGMRMTQAEFNSAYINALTGRIQNVPPGDEGRELIKDARANGWLVSRSMDDQPGEPGWATDAGQAVYKSGSRAVRAVWESVSHRTWQAGLTKEIAPKSFELPSTEAMILQKAGMDVQAGQTFTYGEFHQTLHQFSERFDVAQPHISDTLSRGTVHGQLALDDYGRNLIDALDEVELDARHAGIDSIEDWPEETKAQIRAAFAEAINLGITTEEDYRQEIEPLFGPLHYEAPVPPPVDELEQGISVAGEDREDMEVVDGDTISLLLADGPMRVRFIGINAPEATQAGYGEARSNLAELLEGADDIVIGIYKPELFGLTQLTAPGERRLLAWLYVDGVPIYDASVFTADNPRGAGVGGNVVDLQTILKAG